MFVDHQMSELNQKHIKLSLQLTFSIYNQLWGKLKRERTD